MSLDPHCKFAVAAAAVAGVLVQFAPVPAEAAIRCNGRYQIVSGQELATPYCGDNYLAAVAREYGWKVTDSEIRNNPGTKLDVCRIIGRDNRVQEICSSVAPFGRGPRF